MAETIYLEYTITLTDKALVDAQVALFPNGIRMAPEDASIAYDAFMLISGNTWTPPPHITSPWFPPNSPNSQYPRNVASFTRKVGGWFGIGFLFGTTKTFRWVGRFVYGAAAEGEIGGVATEVVAIAQTKCIVGFELPGDGGGEQANLGAPAEQISREASRHPDGFGFAYVDQGDQVQILQDAHRALNSDTWERFYIRVRTAPTTAGTIWEAQTTNGARIRVTPDMRLALYSFASTVESGVLGTSSDVLEVGRWYRIDLILHCHATTGGWIEVYIGRKRVINRFTFANGTGLSTNTNHSVSRLGGGAATTDVFECDFDDYRSAAHPTQDSGGRYVGIDWLNGTKIQKVDVDALGAGNAWTGDYRYTQQHNDGTLAGPLQMTTTTSAAALVLDAREDQWQKTPGSIGPVSFLVAWFIQQQSSIAGSAATFGWRFDGLLDLLGIAMTVNTYTWIRRAYQPSGLTVPIEDLAPFELQHIKYGNVSAANCKAAALLVELVGTFGEEDIPVDAAETTSPPALPPRRGIHMADYPESPWARASLPPISAVVTHSGTYVGTGSTPMELQFRCPVTWFFVRRVSTSANGGTWWNSGMIGVHSAYQRDVDPTVRFMLDPAFVPTGVEDDQETRTIVRIISDSSNLNNTGDTYQYVAFEDPGARFSLNGGFHHTSALATAVNTLRNSQFTPDGIFAFSERSGSADSSFGLYFAGAGTVGTAGTLLSGSTPASLGSIAAGQFTTVAGLLHSDVNVGSYAAFRMDDHSTDPNKGKVLRVGTYTGDGSASRTISWAPSGLRPLWAIVMPANAQAFFRDPTHTANTSSSTAGGAAQTTGITAGGIDQMTVGALGNANGIVYHYFVLLGSETAGNGGWSINGEFAYVEPDSPADDGEYDDGDASEEPDEVEPPDTDPDPGPDDEDDCADGAVCVAATTRLVNLALLEIGSVQVLTNYCTQDTKEAVIARTIYEQCVRHTLITYPWPFATKYAELVLIAAQPSNEDWTYAYRMPVDCIFPRRIVVARGAAVDPSPPPMGLSSDDTGGIILCNEPDALLEYTARPGCVGFNGDDLFREALKWRLAAALAPPLTRIAGEAERCLKMFEIIVQKAESVVKQGVPGLRQAASSLDVSAAAVLANIQVCNMALVKIGSRTIANLATEQTREAVACNMVFEDVLRQVLRDFPWAFATRYVDPATLVDGEEGDPATPDWTFSHRLPSDFVFLRRLVTTDGDWADGPPRGSVGRSFDPEPYPFRLGTDATGGLLYSNVEEPVFEYTARLTNLMTFADPLFREALSWKLASTLAPSLASVELHRPEQHGRGPETPQDPTRRIAQRYNDQSRRVSIAQWANAMYERTLADAAAADRNESQPEPHGDADWIRGRQ